MNEKLAIVLGIGLSASVVVAFLFFMGVAGNIDSIEYIYFALIITLVAGTIVLLIKKTRDLKRGLPVGDELSKMVVWKAGYYTYLATIYIAVSILWYNGLIGDIFGFTALSAEKTIGVIVLSSGVVFLGLSFYFNKKGDIE